MTIKENLLQIFKEAGESFLSGEQLSKQLGCTRAAIWKQIEELRKEGYKFEAVRKSGYRLVQSPDLLTPEEISFYIQSQTFGRNIEYFSQAETTQVIAHRLAEEGAPEGTVVIADEQVQGRGRLGRIWHSPPGAGIWMSLILRPQIELNMAPQLTLMTAVAVVRAIRKVTGADVKIKWPNDILLNRKKICGILCELNAEWDQVQYVIVGIGMNVNVQSKDFPEELQHVATSLLAETGKPVTRAVLVSEIFKHMEELYELYPQHGFSFIKPLWESYAGMLGKKITIRSADGPLEGTLLGIDENGVLLLQLTNGIIKKIYSADLPTV